MIKHREGSVTLHPFRFAVHEQKSFWNSSETFGFLNLFLQKKGLSRRRHSRRSRGLERSDKYGKKAQKGVWGRNAFSVSKNEEFSPLRNRVWGKPRWGVPQSDCGKLRFPQSRVFGGSMPPKTPKSAYKSYLAAREKQEAKPKRFFGFDARKIARERANRRASTEVKAGSNRVCSHANNPVKFTRYGRDCTRAISAVRCRRNCTGFAEAPFCLHSLPEVPAKPVLFAGNPVNAESCDYPTKSTT